MVRVIVDEPIKQTMTHLRMPLRRYHRTLNFLRISLYGAFMRFARLMSDIYGGRVRLRSLRIRVTIASNQVRTCFTTRRGRLVSVAVFEGLSVFGKMFGADNLAQRVSPCECLELQKTKSCTVETHPKLRSVQASNHTVECCPE
jgi:hypothetical protein